MPVQIDSGPAFQIEQVFDAHHGEAFYGLGQHQQAVMNYRDEIVDLVQNNTEVAIPFLISNKNYGLLWENYSESRFGDGRQYASLNTMELFNDKGERGGLTATYSQPSGDSTVMLQRMENRIEYDFLPSCNCSRKNFHWKKVALPGVDLCRRKIAACTRWQFVMADI